MGQEFAGPIGMAHANHAMCNEDTKLRLQSAVVGLGSLEGFTQGAEFA